MLQIRLRKPTNEGGGGSKFLPPDSVTVSCPDHLVLADLPVAKSLGSPSVSARVKIVGRRSRRQLGKRVHFCSHCDFPIAVYGRLSPCEHAFCLDCARSDSFCFMCNERIQKIQTIMMMEGMIICAAPHCLKSFLKKSDFETHIVETHGNLLHPGARKEGNNSEVASTRKPAGSDSIVQAPPRPPFPAHPSSQPFDVHRPPSRDQSAPKPVMPSKGMPAFSGTLHNTSEQFIDNNTPPGFDRPGPQNRFAQQGIDLPGSMRQETGQLPDKQQGFRAESPFPEYPFQLPPLQPPGPNYTLPVMMNPALANPQLGYPPFLPEGSQPTFGAPNEMIRPESAPEQGSEPGFPPGPLPLGVNFDDGYPRPWHLQGTKDWKVEHL